MHDYGYILGFSGIVYCLLHGFVNGQGLTPFTLNMDFFEAEYVS